MEIAPIEVLALLAVGLVGGIVSVLVSVASLVTYPALLALGLPPVTANVTNTVALVFNCLGAVVGARPELEGQRPILLPLAVVAAAGGATGALLLLLLPGRAFELVAPVLIGVSSILVVLQPRLRERRMFRPRGVTASTAAAYYATAIYAGYFGAAGGIIALVVLATVLDRPFLHVNAARLALAGVSNGVAALAFVLFGPVRWAFAVPLAVGLFAGGLAGPWLARRVPPALLRAVIAAIGLCIAGLLAWRTYAGA